MKLSFRRKLLFISIPLLFFILVLEIFFQKFLRTDYYLYEISHNDNASWRLRWVRDQQKRKGYHDPTDKFHPQLGWMLKPGIHLTDYFGDKTLIANSKGLRTEKEIPYKKENRPRILIFGDSFTFGEEVGNEETYATKLDHKIPEADVLNFGMRGYAHDQMLLYFKTEGVKYKPDVVILGFIGVDMDRNLVSFRSYAKPKYRIRSNRLELTNVPIPEPEILLQEESRHFGWVDFLTALGGKIRYKTGIAKLQKMRLTRAILNEFVEEVEKSKAIPILAYLPATHEVKPRKKKTQGERFFEAYCGENTVRCINIRPFFVSNYEKGIDFGPGHWNQNGHSIVADELYSFLKKEGIIDDKGTFHKVL